MAEVIENTAGVTNDDKHVAGHADDIDVDKLLNDINSPSPDGEDQAGVVPKPDVPQTYELTTSNGQKVKATQEQLLKWATAGYETPNRLSQMSKELNDHKAQLGRLSPYKAINDYAEKNPGWWKYVEDQWASRQNYNGQAPQAGQAQTQLDPNNPLALEIESLRAQIKDFADFKNKEVETRQSEREKQEDHELETQMTTIRKEYPDFDWNSPDETGKNLEMRVLDHAQKSNISSFRAAFRDFMHDELLKRASEKGKDLQVKSIQKTSKLGLIGKTTTPVKGLTNAQNFKKKSYGDLEREAIEELGISAS